MKKFFLSLLIINFSFLVFALPGFKSFIPDTAGEFVYYKDNSFNRESYIGLLSYGPATYQMRYYAPANNSLPEKTVAILFSINSEADIFEMTGENVIIADYTSSEEVDIVNYMHDLLYELIDRRVKYENLTPETEGYVNFTSLKENGLTVAENYPQFGGDIKIVYDVMIPFLNVKRIEDTKGNALFECVELGKISKAEDTDFDKFVVVPEIAKVKINSVKAKKAAEQKFILENQKITIDKTWEQKNANMCVQSDDALITMATYMNPNTVKYLSEYYLIRSLLESQEGSFINLDKCDVIFDNNAIRIYSENYMAKTSKVFYGIKYLTMNEDENYDFMSFATTKANYLLKRSYYDKIIKSYTNK